MQTDEWKIKPETEQAWAGKIRAPWPVLIIIFGSTLRICLDGASRNEVDGFAPVHIRAELPFSCVGNQHSPPKSGFFFNLLNNEIGASFPVQTGST